MAIQIDNTNTGTLTLKPGASGTYSLVFPIAVAAANGYVLSSDTSGNLSWVAAGGSGTVTAVSVVSANGFAGSSSGGTTPALTISTSITGVLKGNGTAISAATAGTDYQAPIGTISGVVKGNGANALTAATAGTDYLAPAGTFNLGTTSITFNRASASQSLTGIIDISSVWPNNLSLTAAIATTANTTGAGLSINAGAGFGATNGPGGVVTITGGNGAASGIGVGGNVTVTAGAGGDFGGNGGDLRLRSGSPASGGFNSSISLVGGLRAGGGGTIAISGGQAFGANQAGGVVTISAGISTGSSSASAIEFYTTPAGASSSTAGTSTKRLEILSTGQITASANITSTSSTAGTLIVTGGVGVSENMYVGGYSQHVSLARTNARFASAELTPTGHYTPGETVFEIDPTWSQAELQKFFNTTGVTWLADTTSPAGYAIQMDGAINFGSRAYASGFPMIPVETNDIYYMELWLRNDAAYVGPGHYAGGVSMDAAGTVISGNPGSYDYFVMSNTAATTTWTKYSAYITGFAASGSAAGTWPTNTKYWSPLMLANYTFTSGTRRSYLSGWRVYKVYQTGRRKFADMVTYSTAAALTAAGTTQGTALALTSDINNVTTVAASTGVILPFWQTGHRIIVRNAGANALAVYPNSGAQINSLGSNVAFSILAGTSIEFVNFTSTQWSTLATTYA